MVINDKEAEDLGLTHELMWRRFCRNKPVYIGSTKYIITDVIQNIGGCASYKLVRRTDRQ